MAFDPFHVDLDGVLGLSRVHARAAEALNGSTESALAKSAGADLTHGSIGTRVTGAFSELLDARHEALTAAAHTSGELSQRLAKAVWAYGRGDESGAESVRAAAEAIGAAPGSSGTPIAAGSSGPSGAVGAAESSGVTDALGQAAPQGAQLAQTVAGAGLSAGVGAGAAHSDGLAVATPTVVPPARSADEQAEKLTRD
ncbi:MULTISPECIES: type VII secretion target [unclassified Mycobacterium]|uniref:type VII secretion target n=1 Tax=unclassified Mycobacterium TaxID=2642494 RepID=UPI0029C7E157|nr:MULTISPECIES: type VII secretion target [unclassified Mycobacterium]